MLHHRLALGICVGLLAAGLTGCGGNGAGSAGYDLFTEELETADRLWSRDDLDQARAKLKEVLTQDPESFGALYRLGIWTLQDDPGRAREYFERATVLDPNHPGPIFFSGMCQIPFNRFEEADREMAHGFLLAQKRLGYSLPDTSDEARKGLTAFREGKYEYAASLFSTAVKTDPKNATLWLLYGKAHLQYGLFDKAEQGFSRALELRPEFPEVHVWRGELLILHQKLAQARVEVNRALDQNPHLGPALLLRGRIHLEESEFRLATHAFWRAVLEDPTVPEAYQRLSDSLFRISLPQLAPVYLQQLEWTTGFLVRYYGSPLVPDR